MKMKHLFALPALLFCLSGCTVHNHYYGNSTPRPSALPLDSPVGHDVLADKLAGINSAIEVVSKNLANANTTAYKARRATFVEGQAQPQISTDWHANGVALITDRPLDLFISGPGFFQIDVMEEYGGGVAYTRVGNLFVNAVGELVLGQSNGPRLSDGITVSEDAVGIRITTDGTVSEIAPDNSASDIGQLTLYHFLSPEGLALVDGLYRETESSGPPVAGEPGTGPLGTLQQGMLEGSNVDFVPELVKLKMLTRWADAISGELGFTRVQRQALFTTPYDGLLSEETAILSTHDR